MLEIIIIEKLIENRQTICFIIKHEFNQSNFKVKYQSN